MAQLAVKELQNRTILWGYYTFFLHKLKHYAFCSNHQKDLCVYSQAFGLEYNFAITLFNLYPVNSGGKE